MTSSCRVPGPPLADHVELLWLSEAPAVGYALGELQRAHCGTSIAELGDRVGLSSRRLIEVFRNEVGLTPKLFARLARFRRVLRLIDAATEVDWCDVALACGYFDQSHLIHDFRAFAGVSPAVYRRERTSLNHVRAA